MYAHTYQHVDVKLRWPKCKKIQEQAMKEKRKRISRRSKTSLTCGRFGLREQDAYACRGAPCRSQPCGVHQPATKRKTYKTQNMNDILCCGYARSVKMCSCWYRPTCLAASARNVRMCVGVLCLQAYLRLEARSRERACHFFRLRHEGGVKSSGNGLWHNASMMNESIEGIYNQAS